MLFTVEMPICSTYANTSYLLIQFKNKKIVDHFIIVEPYIIFHIRLVLKLPLGIGDVVYSPFPELFLVHHTNIQTVPDTPSRKRRRERAKKKLPWALKIRHDN